MNDTGNEFMPTSQEPQPVRLSRITIDELKMLAQPPIGAVTKAGGKSFVNPRKELKHDEIAFRLPSQTMRMEVDEQGIVRSCRQTITEEGRIEFSLEFDQVLTGGTFTGDDLYLHFSSRNQPEFAAGLDPQIEDVSGMLYRNRSEKGLKHTGSIVLTMHSGETLIWDKDIDIDTDGVHTERIEREYSASDDDEMDEVAEDQLPGSFQNYQFEFTLEGEGEKEVLRIRVHTAEKMLEATLGELVPTALERLPSVAQENAPPQPLCRFSVSFKNKN